MKRFLRKISKKSIRVFLALLMLISYFSPAIKVFAQDYNTSAGDKVLSVGVDNHDELNFQLISVKVNDNNWESQQDCYYTNDDEYTIVIAVKKLTDKVPDLMYGGNWGDYVTKNVAIAGDIYTFTFVMDKSEYPVTQEDPGTFFGLSIEELGNPGDYHPEYDTKAYVNVTINGHEFEPNYDGYASEIKIGINEEHSFYGIDPNKVEYTLYQEDPLAYSKIVTTEPMEIGYPDISQDTIIIGIKVQWNSLLTDVVINDQSFADQLPTTKEDLIEIYTNQQLEYYFEVDKTENNTYDVEITGRKQHGDEILFGNFLWNYDPNAGGSEDDMIPNAKLEFVQAVVDDETYTSVADFNAAGNIYDWHDAVRKEVYTEWDSSWGSATLPVGTELTVKLIPDPGYQLTSFGLNGNPFEPGDEPCVYTFTITGGNFHLEAKFTEEGNEVKSNVEAIRNGAIEVSNDAFEYGTAKLEVDDASNLNADRKAEFDSKASEVGFEVTDYLDLSLFNTVYKGGLKDNNGNFESWDQSITNLDSDAVVVLELKDDMAGKEFVVIHEIHDGDTVIDYEIIEADYYEELNAIAFETNSFSNYAIAEKDAVNKDYTVTKDGNSIFFTKPEGHNYSLDIINWFNLTDEQLQEREITKEEYNVGYLMIKDATKAYGTLVGVYDFVITDESNNELHNGPFKIKIKMTDEMKDFNEFYIIYVKDDLTIETPIKLTVEDGYLVGTINHLSNYAITGKKVETPTDTTLAVVETKNETKNPKTADHLGIYLGILGVSFVSLVGTTIYIKKKLTN
ncbi:MAG: hypothetical protein J5892_02295 [Bacilli bacterium]|nr:hypothetical protein [Bacilli bacterium]